MSASPSDWSIESVREVGRILDAAHLFDQAPTPGWTERFLDRDGHHLFIAYLGDVPVGFVSGVEVLHPDKGAEMMLYELGVDESHRRRGIGKGLVLALVDVATRRGCRSMWVPVEDHNEVAVATYRSAGASTPEPGSIMSWVLTAV